jgi:hypothetical protein
MSNFCKENIGLYLGVMGYDRKLLLEIPDGVNVMICGIGNPAYYYRGEKIIAIGDLHDYIISYIGKYKIINDVIIFYYDSVYRMPINVIEFLDKIIILEEENPEYEVLGKFRALMLDFFYIVMFNYLKAFDNWTAIWG